LLKRLAFLLVVPVVLANTAVRADYRITRDHGGLVDEYKAKYAELRDRGERVVIDGICNSACTLVLGIVPLNRICVTPRARLGFHQAYYDKRWTFGLRVTSSSGTDDMMTVYPVGVQNWIRKQGGLTPDMKRLKNGYELWMIVNPCPDWPDPIGHADARASRSASAAR